MPRLTPAQRARALHACEPALTPTQIARRIGSSRQAVQQALAAGKGAPPGRPLLPHVTLRCRVPRALLPYLDALIERDGCYSGRADALVATAEAELVPENEWAAYVSARDGTRKPYTTPRLQGPWPAKPTAGEV